MTNIIRTKNFYLMLVLDVFLVISSYLLACVLRFEGQIPPGEWQNLREDEVSSTP